MPAPRQQQQQQQRGSQPHEGATAAGLAPLLIDLSSEPSRANAPQPDGAHLAASAAVLGSGGAFPVRPHPLMPSGGSGAFGSPVGPPRRPLPASSPLGPSSLGASPRGFGTSSSAGEGLRPHAAHGVQMSHLSASSWEAASVVLGALQQSAISSAAPSLRERQSTGSGSNEWTAFAAASFGQAGGTDQRQQQHVVASGAGVGQGPLRGSGGALGTAEWQQQVGGSSLRSSVAGPQVGQAGAALNSRMAVKADAFGGLLTDTVSLVSEDLAVRRRTSSQDRTAAAAGSGEPAALAGGATGQAAAQQGLQEEPSWADFTGPVAAGEFGSGDSSTGRPEVPCAASVTGAAVAAQQQRQLAHTSSWGEWSSPEVASQLAAELAQKCIA
jgi:hypothetical protein